jgi:hypothetical protein
MAPATVVDVEAHVIQTGKLLLPSGEIADNREHSLTSKSRGCPSVLEQTASLEWWLSSVSYPTEVIPDGEAASILASRPFRDRLNRDWIIFASITKPLERANAGRPYLRSRILAVPAKSARQSWSLPSDVVANLPHRDDFNDETEGSRFNRETVWIRQSLLVLEAERGEMTHDLEVSRQIADYIVAETMKGANRMPLAVIDMDRHGLTVDQCALGLALAMRKARWSTALPFIIGIRTGGARIDLSDYAAVFSRT